MEERNFIDLFSLQELIRGGVEDALPGKVWVRAEISEIKVKSNGHCYLELSQESGEGLAARANAVIWRSRYAYIGRYFEAATGSPLSKGQEVLLRVQVTYHPVWGLTLTVDEVEAAFTVGERELQRRRTLERLAEEGLMDLQARLRLNELPYSLAVVSAEDAAGYGDFRRHLLENPYGFAYRVDLYPAAMQGAAAPQSIADALAAIGGVRPAYDAVLILRGGGSELDLSCFDDYSLAVAIARCSVPVFTAIGHDKDVHVADQVAFTSVKTPTALADLFLDATAAEDHRLETYGHRLKLAFRSRLDALEAQVDKLELRLKAGDPRNILRRGFSLVLDEKGVRIHSASGRRKGDHIRVRFADGTLETEVTEVRHEEI